MSFNKKNKIYQIINNREGNKLKIFLIENYEYIIKNILKEQKEENLKDFEIMEIKDISIEIIYSFFVVFFQKQIIFSKNKECYMDWNFNPESIKDIESFKKYFTKSIPYKKETHDAIYNMNTYLNLIGYHKEPYESVQEKYKNVGKISYYIVDYFFKSYLEIKIIKNLKIKV